MTTQITSEGHLTVGGCDCVHLAGEFGTPLYVYDAMTLREQAKAYRRALAEAYPGLAEVAYASKAFLCPELARFWAVEGLGLDVVSEGELAIALAGGFPAVRIHFHGNNKTLAELALALDAGVGRIVVDNLQELALLERLAEERGRQQAIWLRLTPGVEVHTHAYRRTGHWASKFGLSAEDAWQAARRAVRSPMLDLVGLHCHLGSQFFEPEPLRQGVAFLLDFAARLAGAFDWGLKELSPGGGWGVPYTPEDPPAPIERCVQSVVQAIVERCHEHHLPVPRLILEPGRSLIARASVALYTVGSIKRAPDGTCYVAVDGGLADNPRPALYQARYMAFLANRADELADTTVSVVGPYCESSDVLIRTASLPAPKTGDLLAVPVSGAYQLSMASNYNGALRPAAVLVENGEARLLQRRETLEDLLRK
ncbi:MAG TPA: diaminopimelate decarboxylase [Anaerolineae bacterium]|nr:diaminopimelate decarboxylase [Anaerolineae bacterium]